MTDTAHKKPYTAPVLQYHGDVREITQNGKNTTHNDNPQAPNSTS